MRLFPVLFTRYAHHVRFINQIQTFYNPTGWHGQAVLVRVFVTLLNNFFHQLVNFLLSFVNKKALLPKCLHANTFGSKAVFLTYSLTKPPRTLARHPCVLPCTAKTLHFAPPDHSGFALIENCVYLIFNQGICQLNFYEEMHD